MGQKANAVGLRLGINRTWDSRWFASGRDYARLLHSDLKIREALKARLSAAGVSRIIIERPRDRCIITVYAARPGLILGRKGQDIEAHRRFVASMTEGEVRLNIVEIRKPEVDAQLVAENIGEQLERRIAFRRAMKRALQSAMRLGARGVRINVSGRLGGAEIARMEWYREGRLPLQTLRADIDYGVHTARTRYGTIGVKVWIFKGEVLEHDPMSQDRRWAVEAGKTPPPRLPTPRPERRPSLGPTVEDVDRELLDVLARINADPRDQPALPGKLLEVFREAERRGLEQRPLRYRVPMVMPALLRMVTVGRSSTRWRAAYVLAAIRDSKRFSSLRPPEPMPAVAREVRAELSKALNTTGMTLFAHVADFAVHRAEKGLEVSGEIKVGAALPRPIEGETVSTVPPAWACEPGRLSVLVFDGSGEVDQTFESALPEGLASGRTVSCAFRVTLPIERPNTLRIITTLNGRFLEERRQGREDLIDRLENRAVSRDDRGPRRDRGRD